MEKERGEKRDQPLEIGAEEEKRERQGEREAEKQKERKKETGVGKAHPSMGI